MPKAVFLYDCTSVAGRPWEIGGYECYYFDAKREGDEHLLVNPLDITSSVKRVRAAVGGSAHIVVGFPPCTDLASSGARHWARKREADPLFQYKAMQLFNFVAAVGYSLGARWAIENPVGYPSNDWGKPDFTFDPCDYGGYLPEDDVHPTHPRYFPP